MSAIILPRRKFLLGVASLVCAPAVVRASSLMPVISVAEASGSGIFTASMWGSELTLIARKAFLPDAYVRAYGVNPITHMIEERAGG